MHGLKPIFHWKLGLLWLPNANEINTKKMKCTLPTQCNLYSTDMHRGLASRVMQISAILAFLHYQHVGIGNAKLWCWGTKPTPGPNANGFASQWNIGFRPPEGLIPGLMQGLVTNKGFPLQLVLHLIYPHTSDVLTGDVKIDSQHSPTFQKERVTVPQM